MTFNPTDHPHRRFNPLTGAWVVVSPHRMKRPWQGQTERVASAQRPEYDPDCYLCPGNDRSGGAVNPDYESTFVFTNDFPALMPEVPNAPEHEHHLLARSNVRGTCKVICFSPRHDLTLARFDVPRMRGVVDLWAEQTAELGERWRWVQIFENRGEQMGASNPHPHGQIWSLDRLPTEVGREDDRQRRYLAEHGRPLLLDYADLELERGVRVVAENEHWLGVVPYWAVWPFEILFLPRRHVLRIPDLSPAERDALASLLKRVLVKLDNLFETSFPYSMGWHGAPTGDTTDDDAQHWQLHAHLYPPLLRSATVRKFMVGFEMLGEAQRDLTAEQAADRLQGLSEIHYLEGGTS